MNKSISTLAAVVATCAAIGGGLAIAQSDTTAPGSSGTNAATAEPNRADTPAVPPTGSTMPSTGSDMSRSDAPTSSTPGNAAGTPNDPASTTAPATQYDSTGRLDSEREARRDRN